MTVEWRGKPVWVVRRTQEMIDNIEKLNDKVLDPESLEPQQPEYITGIYRASRPEFAVLVGICTHLGCSPQYRPEIEAADLGEDWLGGFFCPCHGSKFDLSGRVYKGVPAPLNLEVPPYKYIDDNNLIIGVDEETA
jgi:ubiquinol-cytochrome c reductase iron-sulfur subunit